MSIHLSQIPLVPRTVARPSVPRLEKVHITNQEVMPAKIEHRESIHITGKRMTRINVKA